MNSDQHYRIDEDTRALIVPCKLRSGKIVEINTGDLLTFELVKLVAYFKRQCHRLKLFERDPEYDLMFHDETEKLVRYDLARSILDARIENDEMLKDLTPDFND